MSEHPSPISTELADALREVERVLATAGGIDEPLRRTLAICRRVVEVLALGGRVNEPSLPDRLAHTIAQARSVADYGICEEVPLLVEVGGGPPRLRACRTVRVPIAQLWPLRVAVSAAEQAHEVWQAERRLLGDTRGSQRGSDPNEPWGRFDYDDGPLWGRR